MLATQDKQNTTLCEKQTLGTNIKQQRKSIEQMIHNFDFEQIEQMSQQIINVFQGRGLGKNTLNKLNTLLIDNIFMGKMKYLQFQTNQQYDILSQYQTILEHQKPFIRKLFKKHEQLKILYAIKVAYKQWDQELQNNIKQAYIQFRNMSLSSISLIIEGIFDIYEKYHKTFSIIHDSQVMTAYKSKKPLIYNLGVSPNDFISWPQYEKMVHSMDVRGYFYINEDPNFSVSQLFSYDQFLELYEGVVGQGLTKSFLDMTMVVYDYNQADEILYKSIFVIPSQDRGVAFCYRVCALLYLLEQQNELINYELALARGLFSSAVVSEHRFGRLAAHVRWDVAERFETALKAIISDCTLLELLAVLEGAAARRVADGIHADVLTKLGTRLAVMLRVQVFNVAQGRIKDPATFVQRVLEVQKALNRLDMGFCGVSARKQQQIVDIFQFRAKADEIQELINEISFGRALGVAKTPQMSSYIMNTSQLADEDPNEGFQLLVKARSLQADSGKSVDRGKELEKVLTH